jgi:hypothetical protein
MGFECRAILVLRLEFGLQLFNEKLKAAKLVAQFLNFPIRLRDGARCGCMRKRRVSV